MHYNDERGERPVPGKQKESVTERSSVYRQNPEVVIEDFDERSLALHCVNLRLAELNATARELVARLDGTSSLEQVARAIAEQCHYPPEAVLADVLAVVPRIAALGIIERVLPRTEEAALSPTPERL